MRKSFWVTLLISAFVCCSLAFAPTADPPYKNLKILPKNITKPELDSLMKSFTKSLGVKCDFCHAKREDGGEGLDFASDKEEAKSEARSMMKMTAKINKKFFHVKNASGLHTKLEVTCYTCHHGQGHPSKKPPVDGGTGGQQGAPSQKPAGT
ncbi:MAG: c-type cytochrome [Chitinophagaceae bacterium]